MKALLRLSKLLQLRGKGRSAHYQDVAQGLYVRPVAIGRRAKAYPEDEAEALNDAVIAGASPDEIRQLVLKLEASRKNAPSIGGAR